MWCRCPYFLCSRCGSKQRNQDPERQPCLLLCPAKDGEKGSPFIFCLNLHTEKQLRVPEPTILDLVPCFKQCPIFGTDTVRLVNHPSVFLLCAFSSATRDNKFTNWEEINSHKKNKQKMTPPARKRCVTEHIMGFSKRFYQTPARPPASIFPGLSFTY